MWRGKSKVQGKDSSNSKYGREGMKERVWCSTELYSTVNDLNEARNKRVLITAMIAWLATTRHEVMLQYLRAQVFESSSGLCFT